MTKWQAINLDIAREQAAYAALIKLMNDAKDTEALFVAAGLELPPPLMRFFGMGCDPIVPKLPAIVPPHIAQDKAKMDELAEMIRKA